MSNYGEVAIQAANLTSTTGVAPLEAWEAAAKRLLHTPDLRAKGCPKAAFLGLCAAGLVKNVAGGYYDGALESPNAQYAVAAIKVIRLSGGISGMEEKSLWDRALKVAKGKEGTVHNQQMSVVLSLARANLINGVNAGEEAEI